MDPALREMLSESVRLTPTGPPVSGGFGGRVQGVPTAVACRIRGGTRKLVTADGREIVATHEIRIDGATLLLPANATQTLTLTGATDADTYKLSFRGQLTAALRKDALAGTLQTALVGLSTIGTGHAVVTGASKGPYTVVLSGPLAGQALPLLVASALSGGLAVAIVGVNPDQTPRIPRPEDLATMPDGLVWEVAAVDPANDETGQCVTYRLSTKPQ